MWGKKKKVDVATIDAGQLAADNDTGGRNPGPAVRRLMLGVALAWSLFQLWIASPLPFTFGVFVFNDTQSRAVHLALAVFLAFLAYPAFSRSPRDRVPVLDWVFALVGPAHPQQSQSSRPIRYIIPFPPGGSTDPMGRMAAAKLTERLGQQVIVDNRPGGNTVIGTDVLAKATPDGHTIGWVGPAFFSTPSLLPNLPYDSLKDFVGVTTIARQRSLLVLHPSVPAGNLKEVIALLKSKPGQFTFGSSGIGTSASPERIQYVPRSCQAVPGSRAGTCTIRTRFPSC